MNDEEDVEVIDFEETLQEIREAGKKAREHSRKATQFAWLSMAFALAAVALNVYTLGSKYDWF